MKRYKIYKSPLGMIEAVKTGWSWPGFFFTLIWLLVKKLYVTAGMVFLIAIIIGFVEFETGGTVLSSFYNLSIGLIVGLKGNQWRIKNLVSRGFIFKTTVSAKTPEGALASYTTNTNE
ncbi:MAG: DUF2628 domain-containing protein [Cryomorphaceae bacterium]|jgi:hypothetical protein|nr:DUF2628 domain-containing protein [Candidatus Neomarinimicrobiota bacterium]MBT5772199.1 DUF2628 domain-containing protein [Flavobacteriaceae bacterium]MBT6689132.1 DUF2628 domain-containing protein [Flavobacteriaceae bacterium]MBT7433967.1 DUF2628 domain-containing protein [Candidatus Neomarinimicrobiota bacterium]MBT7683641.1 DUF2628 domain-containing protein [Cryomorphaceae bacterium]